MSSPTEIVPDGDWIECKFGEVYQSIATYLCEEGEPFAHDLAEMKTMLGQDAYTMSDAIARCDRIVMNA